VNSGYLYRRDCGLIAEKRGRLYIKPKKNSQMRAKGLLVVED
jgi:hypothetical protein